MIDKSPYRKKLPKLIGSFALIGFGLLAILNSYIISGFTLDADLMIFIMRVAIPSAACLAFIAYLIGRILDMKTNRIKKKKNILNENGGQNFVEEYSDEDVEVEDSYQIKSIFAALPSEVSEMQSEETSSGN